MEHATLVAAASGQSLANGWDAICAINARQVNAIFFQQYLQGGPTSPARPLRAILAGDSPTNYWLLDVVAGPPQVSIDSDLGSGRARVTMFLLRGALIQFDSKSMAMTSAILVQPNESTLTGVLSLAKVTGHANSLGQVVLDLSSGAYQPQVKGVDPGSVLAADIGKAVQTFFAHNETKYPLGTIVESTVSPCLQPTSFEIATQPAPGGTAGDGCVLLLIQTNGKAGTVGALDPYPIPSGRTAALIVSNQVIFNQLMPALLTTTFKTIGTMFAGQQPNNGVWQTVGSGGSIDLGVLGDSNRPHGCVDEPAFTADSDKNPAAVVISTNGLTIAPSSSGSLSVTWSHQWDQQWAFWSGYWNGWNCEQGTTGHTSTLQGSYSQTSAASVDPNTEVVSFSGSGKASLSQVGGPSGLQRFFGIDRDIPSTFTSGFEDNLKKRLGAIELPEVNTFALANLLFPSLHALSFQEASLPGDLLLHGQVKQTLAVTPPMADLKPGQAQQFSAAMSGQPTTDILWEIKPAVGSIDSSGRYIAPSAIGGVEVVVITAIDKSNASVVGGAMVVIHEAAAPTGLIVSPAKLVLTAGQSFNLSVTDETGTPVAATCTLSPNVGTIAQGWTTGEWTYTAPAKVDAASVVTIEATSAAKSSQTGTATLQLVPTTQVTITPASATITAGRSVQLKATSDALDAYTWQIYPAGAGSVTPAPGDSSQATYAAPAAVATPTVVTVVAYGLGDSAGIGLARVTVTSA